MSEKLDELIKLADITTKAGMAALEKEGIPWRPAMGSVTEVLLGLLNSLARIITIQPALGSTTELVLPLKATHDHYIQEIRTYIGMLTVMADLAEEAAKTRSKETALPVKPKPKIPSNHN
jgi:hypothetical protein